MTLCVLWRDVLPSGEDRVVIACDSRITGGYRYDFGTKLMVFAREDCAICWEGSTSYTYSFAVHAKSDIDWSDVLSDRNTDVDAVCKRIVSVFNLMWDGALKDKGSQCRDEEFSFLFAGYSTKRAKCMAWHITRGSQSTFSPVELNLKKPMYVGSGTNAARNVHSHDPQASPYAVLRQVIEDTAVDDVGGVPQAYAIDSSGGQAIGVIKSGERFLFGRQVASSGHHQKVLYVPYEQDI